jgi:hypothetical protein
MVHKIVVQVALATTLVATLAVSGNASPVIFSTGATNNAMAAASQPGTTSEIETADDFFLTNETLLTGATFTGLISGGATTANIGSVQAEIYQIFPSSSDVTRTSGSPLFSTAQVPTRVNSPSDNALATRTSGSNLNFTTTLLSATFTAANSVQPGGIFPMPGQTTRGNGPVTGQEVQFHLTFLTPFDLAAGHYFFVPQVEITTAAGFFLWLSAERPIVTGTSFPAGTNDLQGWTRDAALDPDWLRVGTDIIGPPATGGPAPTFNFSFSLEGDVVPLPATLPLFATGIAGLGLLGWRRKRKAETRHAE